MAEGFNISQLRRMVRLKNAMIKDMPRELAVIARDHFKESFRKGKEGFNDIPLKKWDDRQPVLGKSRRAKRARIRDGKRPVLVDTGDLRDSIQIKEPVHFDRVIVGSQGVEYGVYHNDGTATLPQRKFIGNSRYLNKKINIAVRKRIRRIMTA